MGENSTTMHIRTIGLDLAKSVFQVHAVDAAGTVLVRRTLRRSGVIGWFAKLPPCLVGMEACATAHYWARELTKLGHEVRLIPPAYAKAYVRRNKNDAADAAAICEAVGRPQMRFVAAKSEAQQAAAGIHRVRDLLVRQRTMLINQLRGLMAEFGVVAPKGAWRARALVEIVADGKDGRLPAALREALAANVEVLATIEERLADIDRQILAAGRRDATWRHLVTAPGYGTIVASAFCAIVVDPRAFRRADDFAASIGLVPRPDGTGGKVKLGPISKRGNRYLRRLLVSGAMAVLMSPAAKTDPWIANLLATKPRKVAAVALPQTMARIGLALAMPPQHFPPRPVPD